MFKRLINKAKAIKNQLKQASIAVQKYDHKREQGDFIVNVILAISIIAVIGIFSLKGYSYAMDKVKSSEGITMIQQISQGLQELFSNNRDFTGLTTETVIGAGVVHKSNISDKKILSPWYSTDKASIVTAKVGDSPSSFTIEMDKVPPSACVKIGGAFMGEAASVSVAGTKVNTLVELTTKCSADDSAKKLSFNF